jgi:DNA-binding response OmpR family regulator
MRISVLYVEDEPALAQIICERLESEAYAVTHVTGEEEARNAYLSAKPDIIILDVMLTNGDGFGFAKFVRKNDRGTPILFLSAKSQSRDVIEGFESGGNDYMRKTFSAEELLVRMKALLSDQRLAVVSEPTHVFHVGKYEFDARQQLLTSPDSQKNLTGRETQLLKKLCEHQNALVPKEDILMDIWGDDSFFNSRSLDVFISRIRKYLSGDQRIKIINIRGYGYKLLTE